jgi:hypothetical protein
LKYLIKRFFRLSAFPANLNNYLFALNTGVLKSGGAKRRVSGNKVCPKPFYGVFSSFRVRLSALRR